MAICEASRRIKREMREWDDEMRTAGFELTMVNDNMLDFVGRLSGPPDTPYDKGVYSLSIKVPKNYPFV